MKTADHSISSLLFRFICKPPQKQPAENLNEYFAWRTKQCEKFFSRFRRPIQMANKMVLDYGCGLGSTSFFMSSRGAFVHGVDTWQEHIDYARNRRRTQPTHPNGTHPIFSTPDKLGATLFDLIISEDCFEHYEEPEKILAEMKSHLAPGGKILIGFSPLWKSPSGGHIGYMTKLPWAHLIFPERVIMEHRKQYRPNESAAHFSEIPGGLNKMTYARFAQIVAGSGLKVESMETNVSDSRFIWVANLLRRIPGCFEYFTKNIYTVLTLP